MLESPLNDYREDAEPSDLFHEVIDECANGGCIEAASHKDTAPLQCEADDSCPAHMYSQALLGHRHHSYFDGFLGSDVRAFMPSPLEYALDKKTFSESAASGHLISDHSGNGSMESLDPFSDLDCDERSCVFNPTGSTSMHQ